MQTEYPSAEKVEAIEGVAQLLESERELCVSADPEHRAAVAELVRVMRRFPPHEVRAVAARLRSLEPQRPPRLRLVK